MGAAVVMARRATDEVDTGVVLSGTTCDRRVVSVIPLFQHMIEGKQLLIHTT